MGKIILLDPGHGLEHDGFYERPLMNCNGNKVRAVAKNCMKPHKCEHKQGFYREDHGTLAIAQSAAKILEAAGHTVYLTRKDKYSAIVYLSNLSTNKWKKKYWKEWRWVKDFTLKKQADIFVGLHTNAGRGKGASCFWASSPNGIDLSYDLVGELRDQLNIKTRKVAKHRYLKLRNVCDGRAVFLECLFHDNINEIKLMLTQKGIDSVGKAVADGIHKHSLKF